MNEFLSLTVNGLANGAILRIDLKTGAAQPPPERLGTRGSSRPPWTASVAVP